MKYKRVIIPITENKFLLVFFWKKLKDFRKATDNKDGDACYLNGYGGKNYPTSGELHFVKGRIGSGVVAHELMHATVDFCKKTKLGELEEYACEVIQVMTNGFWNTVFNNKKLKKWIYGKEKK
jgi:hypothetical protein